MPVTFVPTSLQMCVCSVELTYRAWYFLTEKSTGCLKRNDTRGSTQRRNHEFLGKGGILLLFTMIV